MNPQLLIVGLLVLILLTNKKKEAFTENCKYYEPRTSNPRKVDYNKKPLTKQMKPDPLVWEKRFPGLVKQRYSYDDSPKDNRTGQLEGSRPTCYPHRGAELKDLPVNYNNQWKATIDARLLNYYPLLNADAEYAKKEEDILRSMDGGLYNIAKKSGCVKPFSVSNVIPGQYMTRNNMGNDYHLASAN